MATVKQLIRGKGALVHTIRSTDTVFKAIGEMDLKDVGSLVVVDWYDRPIGILTERDYLRKVALQGRASKSTFVAEIMSTDLVVVDPETDAEECISLMTYRRIRHLPVLEEQRLVGIISIGDVVKHLADERAQTITELTGYIQGRYV